MDYKAFVGPAKLYGKIGKLIFELMKEHGLKKKDKVLDIGCGSLRVGQHLINYLNQGNYYGIDPNKFLIDAALKNEKIKANKKPNFDYNSTFDLNVFGEKFDFIIANSIFIHADKMQVEKCIKEALSALADNGVFIFNFIPGKDNEKKGFQYPGAVTYSKTYIEGLLKEFEYIECKYPGKQIFLKIVKKNEAKNERDNS